MPPMPWSTRPACSGRWKRPGRRGRGGMSEDERRALKRRASRIRARAHACVHRTLQLQQGNDIARGRAVDRPTDALSGRAHAAVFPAGTSSLWRLIPRWLPPQAPAGAAGPRADRRAPRRRRSRVHFHVHNGLVPPARPRLDLEPAPDTETRGSGRSEGRGSWPIGVELFRQSVAVVLVTHPQPLLGAVRRDLDSPTCPGPGRARSGPVRAPARSAAPRPGPGPAGWRPRGSTRTARSGTGLTRAPAAGASTAMAATRSRDLVEVDRSSSVRERLVDQWRSSPPGAPPPPARRAPSARPCGRGCSRSSAATVCRLFFTRWWISRIVASLLISSRSRWRNSVTSRTMTRAPVRARGRSGMARSWTTDPLPSTSVSRGLRPLAMTFSDSSIGPDWRQDGRSGGPVPPPPCRRPSRAGGRPTARSGWRN